MRRTILAVLTAVVLALGLMVPPAQAAAESYVQVGHPLSVPGLSQQQFRCSTGAPEAQPVYLEQQGGTVGVGALGWQALPAGSALGPTVGLNGDPAYLNTFSVDVLAPTGATGWVMASFTSGAASYRGWAKITLRAGGWLRYDWSALEYDWDYYYDGVYQDTYNDIDLQTWAAGEGSPSVQLSVLLGCGGERYFVDRMIVANAQHSLTYDLEPQPTPTPTPPPPPPPPPHHVAHLEWSTNGKKVLDGSDVVIRYGQSLWMLGHGHLHGDAGPVWYSGLGTLTAQPTKGKARTVARDEFDPQHYASFKVSPKQKTIYQFTADPYASFSAAASERVTVHVASRVSARVVDRYLVQGQRLAVKGKVKPGAAGVKVTLQRKVGKHWKRVTSSRTRRNGKFTLAKRVSAAGSMKVRVKLATTLTNLGTVTGSAKVRVKRYVPPKPKPQAPPPPPKSDPTPEKPAPVSTPPAPTAPTAPPRPAPTGDTPDAAPENSGETDVAGAGGP